LIISGKCLADLKIQAESKLASTLKWFKDNNFIANPEKTQILLLGKRNSAANGDWGSLFIKSGDSEIYPKDSIKLLGVTIDKDLSFTEQTGQVMKRIGFGLKLCSAISRTLPVQTRQLLLNTYVLSQADYCGALLLSTSLTQQKRIEKVLMRCWKALHLDKTISQSAITNIRVRHIIRMMTMFHGAVHHKEQSLTPLLAQRIHVIQNSSRAVLPIRMPLSRTNAQQNSLLSKCCRCWNQLPRDVDNEKGSANSIKFSRRLEGIREALLTIWT
jgi:hypothetical protein